MEQDRGELNWLMGKISGASSILEIGCRFGDSIKELAKAAKPGAKIRAIDHGQPSGECPNPSKEELAQAIEDLKAQGYDADVLVADSHDPRTLEWAKQQGPFDFIYIDADHSYEGVKQDWEWYGPLAARVGFHDIGPPTNGPAKLWQELGKTFSTQEAIMSGMGTGIVSGHTNGKTA
jgi:predicted O-methyltransferase YrrM